MTQTNRPKTFQSEAQQSLRLKGKGSWRISAVSSKVSPFPTDMMHR
jgi:hypothetical protein